jgi:cytochrome c peroxidase
MRPPSILVEVLRTLPAVRAGSIFPIIALVAMIPHSSLAAGKSGDGKPAENSAALGPCFDPHDSRGGRGASRPCDDRSQLSGEQLFRRAFPGTNGRSCATCHVPEENFTLTPAHVERVLKKNPKDPLFSAIDADDPTAKTLTFEHLKKGLIRVGLTLPANMDSIDEGGNVTTPPDRRIFVWRAVPSIADVALTAPYQLDGREATLEQQAQGAVSSHSEGGTVSRKELERIADFERTVFSSERARWVARGAAFDVEDMLMLTPAEKRGKEVYKNVCTACHGGGNKTTIVNRVVHDMAFPALQSDGSGNVLYKVPATNPQTPLLAAQSRNEFINIGSAVENYLAQMGQTEHVSFTKDLSFPMYRFRFYTDASRKEITAELPPALPPEDPFNPRFDSDGNPITGPNFSPQLYTTDPGRAAITGNPYDFEAFDIPTLRGIGKTAPYWHNHISATLEQVVELYSDHLLSKFPTLTQPGEKEQDPDGNDTGPEQTMTRQQKDDLVAFLKRL